jgi:hypothetical protein
MRGWGIDYFNVDFMYAGGYEGRRRQYVTGVEAYRQALGLIRQAIGPEPELLACGAPILPSVGFVDAMRVGPDIAASYEPPDGNPVHALAAQCDQEHGRESMATRQVLGERPGLPDGTALGRTAGGLCSRGGHVRRIVRIERRDRVA